MSLYRQQLPQLNGHHLLTDGGLETTLVFHNKLDLPAFAAYPLLGSDKGRELLNSYLQNYLAIAKKYNRGFVLETPTWRTNPDWCNELGHDSREMRGFNLLAVELMEHYRRQYDSPTTPFVISGCIGPRHDAYAPETIMTAEEAKTYHSQQIEHFAESTADYVTAMTISNSPEAIGIVQAANEANMPVVISFTLETDGRLPSGEPLDEAIAAVERNAQTSPAYYMINCAHPTHFIETLAHSSYRDRIMGIRANASRCSHAELDEAEVLDDGDPQMLGQEYTQLTELLPNLRVLGGCCGTDHRHIEQICAHHVPHEEAC